MKALERNPNHRYQTARQYAIAIETAGPVALSRHVGEWVERIGGDALSDRSSKVAHIEKQGDAPEFANEQEPANARARLRADPHGFAGGRPSSPQLILSGDRVVTARLPSIPTAAVGPGEITAAEVPTVSVVEDHKGARASSRRRAVGVAALVLLGAAGLVWGVSRSHEPAPVAPLPIAASSPPPVETAPPPAEVPLSTSPTSDAPPASAAPVVAPKAHPAAAGAHPALRQRDCNPPWVLDSKGIRRVKPQCT